MCCLRRLTTSWRSWGAIRPTWRSVDRDGNEVSLIQSNSGNFGSGLVPEGTGFVLQNRGGGFTLDAGAAELRGTAQAPAAHDHSGVHAEGRRVDRIRHSVGLQPGAGACAVRGERRRLRHEHPGGAGRSAVQRRAIADAAWTWRTRYPHGDDRRAVRPRTPGHAGAARTRW